MAEEELRTKFLSTYAENIDNGLYMEEDVSRIRENDVELLKAYVTHFKGVVDDAVSKMDVAFQWRKSFGVKELSDDTFPKSMIENNIIFFSNTDKNGDCILHIQCVKMKKDSAFTDVAKKLLVSRIERHFQNNLGKRMVVLYDMSGTGLNNVDTDFIRFLISCFTNYYPATLSYLLLVEMPWILNAVWAVVKKWLSAEQQKHVRVVKKADLLELIDKEQLFSHLGGNCSSIKDPILPKASPSFTLSPSGPLKASCTPLTPPKELQRKMTPPTLKSSSSSSGALMSSTTTTVNQRVFCRNPTVSTPQTNECRTESLQPSCLDENMSSVLVNPSHYLEFNPVYNISNSIYITNLSHSQVFFKIRSTRPSLFKVSPHWGMISASSTARVVCTVLFGSKVEKLNEKMMVSWVMVEKGEEVVLKDSKQHSLWDALPRTPTNHADHTIECRLDDAVMSYFMRTRHEQATPPPTAQMNQAQFDDLRRLLLMVAVLASFPLVVSFYHLLAKALAYFLNAL